MAPVKGKGKAAAAQVIEGHQKADPLGGHRSDGGAQSPHVEPSHQEEVGSHVDNTG